MPDAPSSSEPTLPLDAMERVNALCLRFEEAWQAGGRPRLEEFLAEGPAPARAALLTELALLELHYRRQAGDSPGEAEYLARFPADAQQVRAAFASFAGSPDATRVQTRHADDTIAPSHSHQLPEVRGYEVLCELGRGGMGVVYKARQFGLNRIVALKVVRPGADASAEVLDRFRREAEAVARLRHPNIVQIHEVGEHEGRPYFSMEYVEGGGLDRSLRDKLPSPDEAAGLLESIARAAHAIHRCGVVHRDLKPANVLLTSDGAPKISDFGLAKRLDDEAGYTATGQVLGTPGYMAPEQASGASQGVTAAADVYALGAILYECLTGRPPFRAANWEQTVRQVIQDEPVPPRRLNPALPRDLETICLKCLEKSPARRYADAETLAEDLRRFRQGESIQARPAGRVERLLKWVKRRPAAAGLVLVSGLAAATVTGVLAVTAFIVHGNNTKLAHVNADLVREQKRAVGAEQQAEARAGAEQEQRARAETARHAIQMEAALRAWHAHDVALAERILRDVPGPFRATWEYRHLQSLIRRKALPLQGDAAVHAVAFHTDGTRLTTVSPGATVRVWDAASGAELCSISKPSVALCLSADGTRVAVTDASGTVRVLDALSGAEVVTIGKLPARVSRACFSADGTRLATSESKRLGETYTLRVWDLRTVAELFKFSDPWLAEMCLSHDGARLAASNGSHRMVWVWDVNKRKEIAKFHAGIADALCFSPNDAHLATADVNGTVNMWDAQTGKLLHTLRGHTRQVFGVCFSRDGARLATASQDRTARVWDVATGQPLLSLGGHTRPLVGVSFSPNGARLATASYDQTVRVWDLAAVSQEAVNFKVDVGFAATLAISPDGGRLAAMGKDRTVRLWNPWAEHEGQPLVGPGKRVFRMSFNAEGARLATRAGDGTVLVWDAATGQKAFSCQGSFEGPPEGPPAAVHFSPDGALLAAVERKKGLTIWDALTGDRLHTLGGQVWLAFSPDGKRLVTQGEDAKVTVWDAAVGRDVQTLRGYRASRFDVACFSPDGKSLVTAGFEVKLWDAATGEEILPLRGLTVIPQRISFSPDGKRLLISGGAANAYQTKVWDSTTGQELFTLNTEEICFSPDGKRIAASSKDELTGLREVRVWDAATGQLLLTLGEPTADSSLPPRVRFSPDGQYIAAITSNGTVRVWYGGATP